MQRFFRWQRSVNDCLGPEGPGWPRLDHEVPNRCGMIYLPKPVQEQFIDETAESTPDGRRWPRPTQILMSPGDACITMYHIPHSGTRNEHGTESRKNIIFRIRNKKRQPDKVVSGVTDHRTAARGANGWSSKRATTLEALQGRHVRHVGRVGRNARGRRGGAGQGTGGGVDRHRATSLESLITWACY